VREITETGDHLLFTGEVVAHRIDPAKIDALLRYRRRYAHIGHETSVEAPEGYPT
jgi:flavin reductase (DIM6/NTAB) family NADH-FMN oxidoreductase RutF